MSEIIILDGNHLAYRAYYKFGNLKTLNGVKTSVTYGIPYILESLIRRLKPDKIFMTFDGGRHEYRMMLHPDYKKRDQKIGFDRTDFHRQKDAAVDILMSLGIKIAIKKGFEADDIIAMIAYRFYNKGHNVTIVSGDKDFNQLVKKPIKGNGGISIYNTSKNIKYTHNNMKELIGYESEQCVDYLSLCGDTSDNIPGYPGVGPKTAIKILEKFGSLDNFLDSPEKFGKIDKARLKGIIDINRRLIDLYLFYKGFLIGEKIPWIERLPEFDMDKLKSLCMTYETNSFLKPQFLNTYKNVGK